MCTKATKKRNKSKSVLISASKVQMTEGSTCKLRKVDGFIIKERGIVEVKVRVCTTIIYYILYFGFNYIRI